MSWDDDWRRHAACKGRTDTFYRPVNEARGVLKGSDWTPLAAQRICALCPVARQCLDFAVANREITGIWAGAGGDILRALIRAWRRADHNANDPGCVCDYCVAADDHIERLRAMRDPNIRRMPIAPPRITAGATHGRATTYNRGCRCARCKFSRTVEGKALRKMDVDLVLWWIRCFGADSGLESGSVSS